MKWPVFTILLITFAGYIGLAEDLVTKSGKVYKNYEVTKIVSTGIQILHDAGGATIPFAELPDNLRAKYADQERKFLDSKQKHATKAAEEAKLAQIAWDCAAIVDQVRKNDLICRSPRDNHYFVITDIDVRQYATGDRVKDNVQKQPYTERINHLYVLCQRTAYKQTGYSAGPLVSETEYYWAKCSKCGKKTKETKSRQTVEQDIAKLNQQQCSTTTVTPYSQLIVYEIGKESLPWGDTVRRYTYSRQRALDFLNSQTASMPELIFRGKIDGSGQFIFSNGMVVYRHQSWDYPQDVTVNGMPWKDLKKPFMLNHPYEYSKAKIIEKHGRDKVVLFAAEDGMTLLIDDSSNGADEYTVKIAFTE